MIKRNLFPILFLTLLVVVAYANSLNNSFVSDDVPLYVKSTALKNFSSVVNYPLFFLRSLFNYSIYSIVGPNPLYFRLMNIFFHLGSVITLYLLLTLFWTPILALLAASIFSVHPILTESITWISGGPYVQYSFFFLLSLLFYVISKDNKKLIIISTLLFAAALFSSEKAIILPLMLLLYEFLFGSIKQNWKKLTPFMILGLIFTIFYITQIGTRLTVLTSQLYQPNTGGLYNPLIQLPIAITLYLQLIFWPDRLTLYHSEMTFGITEYLIRLVIFILFLGLIFVYYKKNKIIFFFLCFFIITLIPTITPFKIAWIVAERYVYLGSAGIIFVASYGVMNLIKNKKTETLGYLIFIMVIILLLTRTIIRNIDWKNEDNLWVATGKTSPTDPKTHNNLGDVYGRRGDWLMSIAEFKKAIELNPGYADAYHNLANDYWQISEIDKAVENYNKALSINPRLWQSYENLALIYLIQKKYDLALENIEKAIAINSEDSSLYEIKNTILKKLK